MGQKVYQRIAQLLTAVRGCRVAGNTDWELKHEANLDSLVRTHLPDGSGFDSGTQISLEKSTDNRLVFRTAFHHMNDVGYYTHWTEHKVTVTPDLAFGFRVTVTGGDKEHREYVAEQFHYRLSEETEL